MVDFAIFDDRRVVNLSRVAAGQFTIRSGQNRWRRRHDPAINASESARWGIWCKHLISYLGRMETKRIKEQLKAPVGSFAISRMRIRRERSESTCYVCFWTQYLIHHILPHHRHPSTPSSPTQQRCRDARDDDGLNPMKDQLHLTLSLAPGFIHSARPYSRAKRALSSGSWTCHNLLERFGRISKR